ncbi:MAG: type II secretion system protein [Verrucomicrobia bacterium]|nr:type II secretion system protein [Verrucomicrobiota bacterium]
MYPTKPAQSAFTLVEIMVVIAIIGLLAAIAVPNFVKSRARAQSHICAENLAQIESAKQMWGLEKGKVDGDTATASGPDWRSSLHQENARLSGRRDLRLRKNRSDGNLQHFGPHVPPSP